MINLNRISKRFFHTSRIANVEFYAVRYPPLSWKNTSPLEIAAGVQVSVHRLPNSLLPPECPHGRYSYSELKKHVKSLRKIPSASVYSKQLRQSTGIVEIRGPHGVGYVEIPEYLDFFVQSRSHKGEKTDWIDIWHGQGAEGGKDSDDIHLDFSEQCSTRNPNLRISGCKDDQLKRFLQITCIDPDHHTQGRLGGFYMARIDQYLRNVVNPPKVTLRLVGVGYRASIEKMQLKPDISEAKKATPAWASNSFVSPPENVLFERWIERQIHLVRKDRVRSYLAREWPDSRWAKMVQFSRKWHNFDISLYFRRCHDLKDSILHSFNDKGEVMPLPEDIPEPKKVSLKLGFLTPIDVPLPPTVTATCPDPNTIVLEGIHIKQLYEVAGSIRKLRPPEPYKGKGIFVGNETITLKEKKIR